MKNTLLLAMSILGLVVSMIGAPYLAVLLWRSRTA